MAKITLLRWPVLSKKHRLIYIILWSKKLPKTVYSHDFFLPNMAKNHHTIMARGLSTTSFFGRKKSQKLRAFMPFLPNIAKNHNTMMAFFEKKIDLNAYLHHF